MLERKFQADLIAELREMFPDCYVIKNDPNYRQVFPELLILYGNHWAALEVKQSADAHVQPNQKYYISKLDGMGFAAFIYPENKDEVLYDLSLYMTYA